MHKRAPLALAMALAIGPAPAFAADDLQQIHQEIEALRQSYEARLNDLEQRLKQAEAEAAEAKATAANAQAAASTQAAAPEASGAPAAANAFNPAVSLVLSGTYANLSQDPSKYALTGFMPGGDIGPGRRGFSLGESELGVYANVDPWFYGGLNLSIADDKVAAEEAFLQTTTLPDGVRIKFGRFFSGIGYLNEQHAHTWDFVDAPLAYQAFLGGQLGDDGVQVKWLLPTDQFLEVGGELARGRDFPGSDNGANGAGSRTLFVHTGGDVGDSNSWSAGLSWLDTSPHDRQYTYNDMTDRFDGKSRLWLADFVWKWAPNGNAMQTNFKLQGEYFRRHENGNLTYDLTSTDSTGAYDAKQSGWYLQGVYQFMPRWRVGLRYDRLDSGTIDLGSNAGNAADLGLTGYNPSKYSLMVDWTPSEFSRIRLQLARDKSRQDVTDNQVFVQYQMSLGAHGAHIF